MTPSARPSNVTRPRPRGPSTSPTPRPSSTGGSGRARARISTPQRPTATLSNTWTGCHGSHRGSVERSRPDPRPRSSVSPHLPQSVSSVSGRTSARAMSAAERGRCSSTPRVPTSCTRQAYRVASGRPPTAVKAGHPWQITSPTSPSTPWPCDPTTLKLSTSAPARVTSARRSGEPGFRSAAPGSSSPTTAPRRGRDSRAPRARISTGSTI